jgi:hypothetical protein
MRVSFLELEAFGDDLLDVSDDRVGITVDGIGVEVEAPPAAF